MVNICILPFLRTSFPFWFYKKIHHTGLLDSSKTGKELGYFQNNVNEFSIIFKNLFWRWIKYLE